jgi:hypothetical protein
MLRKNNSAIYTLVPAFFILSHNFYSAKIVAYSVRNDFDEDEGLKEKVEAMDSNLRSFFRKTASCTRGNFIHWQKAANNLKPFLIYRLKQNDGLSRNS